MTEKEIMDAKDIAEKISTMAEAIIDNNKKNLDNIVILGIIDRGSNLAERIAALIKKETKVDVPCGKVDVSIYRDDLNIRGDDVTVQATEIPGDINEKVVVLIDDVIYKGRTALAAFNVLRDFGRPSSVQLYVLIDRGSRDYPIEPTFFAEKITVKQKDSVRVKLKEMDGQDAVLIV